MGVEGVKSGNGIGAFVRPDVDAPDLGVAFEVDGAKDPGAALREMPSMLSNDWERAADGNVAISVAGFAVARPRFVFVTAPPDTAVTTKVAGGVANNPPDRCCVRTIACRIHRT